MNCFIKKVKDYKIVLFAYVFFISSTLISNSRLKIHDKLSKRNHLD